MYGTAADQNAVPDSKESGGFSYETNIGAPCGLCLVHRGGAAQRPSLDRDVCGIQFEWTNPHAHVYIETKDEKGATVVWDCELMSLNHLRSYGWTAKTVAVGDTVSATGAIAKSGDPAMIASRMKLADGREISS